MLEIHLEASAFPPACLIRKAASAVSYRGGSGSRGGPVHSEFMGSRCVCVCRGGEILEVTRESDGDGAWGYYMELNRASDLRGNEILALCRNVH